MFGYTGTYKGKPISVMGSGMGMPSIGIYSYELFAFYGVETIIRIGTAGSYAEDVKVFDVILGDSAWSESTYALRQGGELCDVLYPSAETNEKIKACAKELNIPLKVGRIHSSDNFYREKGMPDFAIYRDIKGCICCEMESFALFQNAKVLGKNAACLLTISDSLLTHQETTSEERETAFTNMMKIALEMVNKQ
ncbi:Purine nucleoside phosphorylase DeoD-type [bioreactor metagenome]|uniref:Purine nucleoside phosphorylase DeoD-type n=1 Tax=bioreactor metagenome TaxID=1076179 RepID=A0A645ARY6_9ZZZZ